MRQLLKITSILALALVFTAGMAFGQDNTVDLEQQDFDNQATIDQTGSSNEASLFQTSFEEENVGEVANITQVGSGNEIGGDFPNSEAGRSGTAVQQGGEGTNTFNANQYGTDNEIGLLQIYGTNTATVRQGSENADGTGNRAFIEQRVLPDQLGPPTNALVTVNQDGEVNFASVKQGSQTLGIGVGNVATINQDTDGRSINRSYSNVARLFQNGDNATATVNQTGDLNRLLSVSGMEAGQLSLVGGQAAVQENNATLTLTQDGERNEVGMKQLGSGADATIIQDNTGVGTADGNQVLLYQDGAHTTNVTQMGDRNQASISQQP